MAIKSVRGLTSRSGTWRSSSFYGAPSLAVLQVPLVAVAVPLYLRRIDSGFSRGGTWGALGSRLKLRVLGDGAIRDGCPPPLTERVLAV